MHARIIRKLQDRDLPIDSFTVGVSASRAGRVRINSFVTIAAVACGSDQMPFGARASGLDSAVNGLSGQARKGAALWATPAAVNAAAGPTPRQT